MGPEYVSGQINSSILEFPFRRFCFFDSCTISKILICFSPIKHFPNDHRRYSSHLQVPILHSGGSYESLINNL